MSSTLEVSETPPDDLAGKPLLHSRLDFPIVGIGASAGGLAALLKLFEGLPGDTGMAFVVVLHLSPKHESNVDGLLQNVTRMKCVQVGGPVHIEANHVYVIPPGKHLTMNDGYLRLADPDRPRGRHVAIDLFFRTLAIVHRERSFGVVLSGTGADGAVGITAIKEHGGVSIVQSPDDAEFDGMPRAAVDTGAIDWVLPVGEIAQKLMDLWANARNIKLPFLGSEDTIRADTPPTPEAALEAEAALREIMVTLRGRTGHDFRHYKRATVLRRIERRLQVNALPDLPSYLAFLSTHGDEPQALLKDLLIGVTNFFRDREAYEALEREVLPKLFEPRGADDVESLRVWTPGCATGEEAYSLAILLSEQAALSPQPRELQLFATDIDDRAIASGRSGLYPEAIVTDVAPTRLRQFFDKEGNRYRVRKEVREKVLFAAHNILRDPPFSRLDLISCRNLLIYLNREVHAEILEMFHFALRPGGYLFLGGSESADAASNLFCMVDKKNRIYQAIPAARGARYAPGLPMGRRELRSPVPGPQPAAETKRISYAEIHQRLAEQYAPPSALIDSDSNIVHLSEQAGKFLHQPGGAPSHNLLTLVRPELRLELRTALYQAVQSGKSVEARRVQLPREGAMGYINMIVRPVHEPSINGQLVLVLFDEVEDTMGRDARKPGEDGQDPVVLQLEEELRRTKEQLQTTIEQSETSTEELKASNEELQAINEELRSATEELETGKEELQSINEELITVNHELKMKVEETSKINDDLHNLIASTDIATVFIDRALSIKRYTPRATHIFNIVPTDVGRSLLDIKHKVDYDQLAEDVAETFTSLRMIERELVGPDGRWYLVRVLPYRTNEDRIDGAVLNFIDITGRRQAEERLLAGEERMRLVAESTKDYAIITFDLEGRITTWNQGAERIFGYGEDILGQPVDVLFQPGDRIAGVAQEEMRRAERDGRAEDDRWHVRRDGTRFFCSGITSPMYKDGRLHGFAKIARDRTGIKQEEVEREARLQVERSGRTAALAANESKNEFLAVMSHELKNPLNLIQLNAELLARLPEAKALPSVTKAAMVIQKTVISQAKIIDDLLDLSRVSTGKLALNKASVNLVDVVDAILSATREEAQRKRIEIVTEGINGPMTVWADPVRIEQIVWNLVSNALKFTPAEGRITVRLALEGRFGRLQIEDTGRGIAPEFLPLVFDMFQQVGVRTTRTEGGLGIGLALVTNLVSLHGGRVDARSEGLGRGAVFSVWLPIDDVDARPMSVSLSADEPERVSLSGRRILAVDDDGDAVTALRELLTMEGALVVTASSAAEALKRAKGGGFDLLLSDVAMPGMDGYSLIEQLRADPVTASLPAVAITGFGRPVDVDLALAAGFDAHVNKPLTLERVLRVVSQVLARKAG
jgi:two-component system CheB/CheR fusion protein